MNSRALAEEYLRRAERYLREARNAYTEGGLPDRDQEEPGIGRAIGEGRVEAARG